MALARLSSLWGDLSGTVGGVTIRHYGRSYVVQGVQTRASWRSPVVDSNCDRLRHQWDLWQSITQDQQQAWTVYAAGHKVRDRMGNERVNTAYQWYQRWVPYRDLAVSGQPGPHDDPPWEDRCSPACGVVSLDWHVSGGYNVEVSEGLVPFGFSKLEMWLVRMQPEMRLCCKNWRKVGFKTFIGYDADIDTGLALAGLVPIEGETVMFKCRWAVFRHWPGPWSFSSTVVQA